jgi:hypothetical protein
LTSRGKEGQPVQGHFVCTLSSWFNHVANSHSGSQELMSFMELEYSSHSETIVFFTLNIVVLWLKHKVSAVGSASVFRCWNERIRWTFYTRPAQSVMWWGQLWQNLGCTEQHKMKHPQWRMNKYKYNYMYNFYQCFSIHH